jgi:hypothetical protein
MPGDIASTFGGGGQMTRTSGGPSGTFGFDPSIFQYLNRRRIDERPDLHPDHTYLSPNDQAVEDAKARAMIAEYKAKSEPPPLRQVSGPNIIPGNVLDTNAMTGAQREAYLPKNSVVAPPEHAGLGPSEAGPTPGPSPIDARADKAQSDREFQLRQQYADEQKREQDLQDRQDKEEAYRKELLAQQGQRTSGPGMPPTGKPGTPGYGVMKTDDPYAQFSQGPYF